jgi:hypothetical protein
MPETVATVSMAGLLGSDTADAPFQRKTPQEQLVPITLELINLPSINLETLIRFREKEEKQRGHAIRDLRHRYVDGLETYVKRLTSENANDTDADEIKRQFADDMAIDLKDLKDELGFARRDALFSKEILLAALAGVGTVAASAFALPVPILGALTVAGLPATVGGVARATNNYLSERRSILRRHPMAYLYELQ